MIRKFIPAGLKRKIRLTQRKLSDRRSGMLKNFATTDKMIPRDSEPVNHIWQPIFYTPLAANKVFNIQLAVKQIHKVLIEPDQVFSFWHIVGHPTREKGYKTGRNIIGDRLQEDIGGGLCQVSGMIYHLALTSGMEIIERHNHTLDLYEENKRYTPLGADATVVYGYKDLRFKNTSSTPIHLVFEVSETDFNGYLMAGEKLPVCEIDFERTEHDTYRTIDTYRVLTGKREYVNHSRYLLHK